MFMVFGLILLSLIDHVMSSNYGFYTNYTVAHITSNDGSNIHKKLKAFLDNGNKLLGGFYDGKSALLLIAPNNKNKTLEQLTKKKIQFHIDPNVLSDSIKSEAKDIQDKKRKYAGTGNKFNYYHEYSEILSFVKHLRSKIPNVFVRYKSIGRTNENREMPLLIIELDNCQKEAKPILYIQCGLHAREWASHATCLWMANEIINNQNDKLLNFYQIHMMMIANPDGYVYSWEKDRMWRKNRSLFKGAKGKCNGIDLNRNWKTKHFCTFGVESDQCDECYCGGTPFSAPETRSIKNHLMKNINRVKLFFDIHMFSELWFYPPAYSMDPPQELDKMMAIAKAGVRGIKNTNGLDFTIKKVENVSGSAADWAYDNGIVLAYSIELRPSTVETGFLLPTGQIIPTANEAFNGIVAAAMTAAHLDGLKNYGGVRKSRNGQRERRKFNKSKGRKNMNQNGKRKKKKTNYEESLGSGITKKFKFKVKSLIH